MISYEEQFLARVFDSVTDPMAIYDREFRILRVNQALLARFRLSLEKVIDRYCYELFYDRTTMCKDCHVEDVFEHGESRMLQKRISTPDGSERIFEVHSYPIKDEKGNTIQAIEHARDITERKYFEAQLMASKEFNEKIINSITDNLTLIDPDTFCIIQANESFYSRIGIKPADVIGEKCHMVMCGSPTPCDEVGGKCAVQKTIRSKQPFVSDKTYPNSNGKHKVLQIATYPIFDNQGELSSIIRLERDVTEKRKMADDLAFRSRELQRAQHQLERLFKISRQVNAKNALSEIVDYAHEVTQEIFPNSVPLIFLLDAGGQNFLSLEGCNPTVLEPLLLAQKEIERSGLGSDFIQYLHSSREPRVIGSTYNNDIPNFLKIISKDCSSWFGFPISAPQQCIGYFVLGSADALEFSHEDIHFFLTLFNQISGHIRYLVIHETEINLLRQRVSERSSHGKIIGQSDEMQKVYKLIDLVSASDATVLITGENGTGKELVAQAIHRQSHRKEGAFVVANCSAYSPALLESELFGHEKGAFTGAIKRKVGRVERAQGGILFLDEIGDIAPATQVLLLRFLQDHCFERVGGEETMEADVRVLAATNRNLYKEVEAGRFRNDLYYRLNVITLHLPPLRDRKEDIPSLCNHFLEKYSLKENKDIKSFSPGAMQIFMDHEWPGNVRQLENAVSHAVILTQGQFIERRHLPQFLKQSVPDPPPTCLAENERRLILNVLQESDGNKHEAARRLKISRSTLYSKIRRHRIEKETV
ncbi:MAG: sigma-54-dependent Fis family transcriptional regulator [Desulfobacteraceae bacterium]|nr:sigma-54-dependent Fis family transcriptional regulator [Desulfobacteraceae bacterium]